MTTPRRTSLETSLHDYGTFTTTHLNDYGT